MNPPTARANAAVETRQAADSGLAPRILLIRPSALGDVCRTVPVLASLRRAYPASRIDWLVQDSFAAAVTHHPALSAVVPFPRKELSGWVRPATWPRVRGFLQDLRARKYDLVLDCQGLARSGLFAWATRARRRVGLANAAELGWLGLTERVAAPKELHAVDRMMRIAAAAGGNSDGPFDMCLYSGPEDRDVVDRRLGLPAGSYVLFAPTTRWPAKLWPADRYARLASELLTRGTAQRIAFVGSAHERGQCEPLIDLSSSDGRVVNLLGQTTVGQLMAVVEGASLVVGNDSAVLHMAVGFDRPLVGLFGPTDVARVGPYGRSSDVIQHVKPGDKLDHKDAAAGAELMRRIGVEEVRASVEARLISG